MPGVAGPALSARGDLCGVWRSGADLRAGERSPYGTAPRTSLSDATPCADAARILDVMAFPDGHHGGRYCARRDPLVDDAHLLYFGPPAVPDSRGRLSRPGAFEPTYDTDWGVALTYHDELSRWDAEQPDPLRKAFCEAGHHPSS
jgi:hypothetical protein